MNMNSGVVIPDEFTEGWFDKTTRDPVEKKDSRGAPYADPIITWADTIPQEEMKWLWKDFIPSAMLTIIAGNSTAGKNHVVCSLASIVSTGGLFPDGSRAEQGYVLIWSGEENTGLTLVPRLKKMGADLKHIGILGAARTEEGKLLSFDPSTEICRLEGVMKNIPERVV